MFKGRHFDRSVILLCVRWHLAYGLSLRNLEAMMAERVVTVDHATIHPWTMRYTPLLLEQFNRRRRAVNRRWHVDKTYIKVRGRWISTAPSTAMATRLNFGSASDEIWLLPNVSCATRSSGMVDPRGSSLMAAKPTMKRFYRAMQKAVYRMAQDVRSFQLGSGSVNSSTIALSRIIVPSKDGFARCSASSP